MLLKWPTMTRLVQATYQDLGREMVTFSYKCLFLALGGILFNFPSTYYMPLASSVSTTHLCEN